MSDFECPICMELIDSQKNIIITECGHKFHCKCLMMNIERNGFGCPYCRQEMVDEQEEDQGLSQGFREEEEKEEENTNNSDDFDHLPSSGFITQILTQRGGVTIEDLIKCLLLENRSYCESDRYYYEFIRTSNKINGRINSIIHRYNLENS